MSVFNLSSIKKYLFDILSSFSQKGIIALGRDNGYLMEVGWVNSYLKNSSIDRFDNPIPWITYSSFSFIQAKLIENTRKLKILEFGSGSSTLFFSKGGHKILSIEHDLNWFNKMISQTESFPETTIKMIELHYGGEYSNPNVHEYFDIILVDGRDRVNCVYNSLKKLNANGIMILDDSERPEYRPAVDFLCESGFKQIAFWGMAPGIHNNKSTTIFYRTNNFMEI